jgi:hypothetical protein
LSEVLSYFPDKAELFIKTQDYASQVVGKKGVWYTIRHKEIGNGVLGNEIYDKGQWEHLGIRGFTGEYLIETITEIKRLRGEGEEGEYPYFQNTERVASLLRLVDTPDEDLEEWGQMSKKVLEVMGVTDEEIQLMREYGEAYREANSMRAQADLLKRRADETLRQAQERVEARFPRKSE